MPKTITAYTFDELSDVECRVGAHDAAQSCLGTRLDRARRAFADVGRHVYRARDRLGDRAIVGGTRQRLLLMAGTLAEHRIEPQRQKRGNHRKQDDVK